MNGQFVGESHDWQAQPIFDIKKFLHAGDNVIAVGVNNGSGQGGLNPNVNVEVIGKARSRRGRAACSTAWHKSSCNPRATPANSS